MSPDEQPTIFTPLPNGTRKSSPGIWQAPTVEEMQAMLPQYEVLEILGRGGMGAVYKGRQKSLKRLVAIKILPLGLADDEMKFAERFQNEAQTMAAMNHPAIVSVHDFGETPDGLLYFIMEFVDGTDVQKMIHASGRLTEEHALAITAHVCDALSYAHKRGVIHRDIKPANILIDQEGHIKVADFGLAKMHDPSQTSGLTKSNMAMGTPDYVAPEVFSPGRVADHRADLYAVGVMLYQMLTGEVPRGMFKLPSQTGIASDLRFDEIICKALEPKPEDRYQSAMDVRHALDVILTTPQPKEDGTGIVSAGPVPQRPVTKQSRPPGEMSQPPTQNAPAQNAAAALKAEVPPKKQSPATLWLSFAGIVMVLGLASFIALGGKPELAVRVQPASASPVDATFMAQVAAAPAARQVELVEQKIEALNGTKVSAEPTIEGEKVTGLRLFRADATEGVVPDISPLAALKDLDSLQLEYMTVGDISCLRGLKLAKLKIWDGKFTDVSVLQSFPLQTLSLKQTSISDFSVLKGKALQDLDLEWCYNLSDISFIKGMPIKYLRVPKTKVRDLSPIAGLPLVELVCDPEAELDPALIASIPTLKKINLKPVSEWPGGSITSPSATTGRTIDLLALVDVKRDTIAGEWVRTADGLAKQGPGTTDKGAPRLQLPYVPPEEYDFEVEFTAVNHNQSVGQIISAQARVFSWIVAGNKAEEPTAGFELFDNNPTSRPSEVVAPMERNLEEGRRYRSRVEVRKAGLRGFLDGVELVNWSGDFKRLSPGTPGNLRDDKHLGLRAARDVIFHKVTVREITGTGKVDAGVNATQSADPAGVTATWTDWLGPRLAKGQYQGNGFIHEKDGITTDLGMKGTNITADDTTDAAIKLTYLLRDSKGAQIGVRNRGTGPTRELYVVEDSGSGLYIGRVLGDQTTMLVSEKYPATISRTGERTLEFRAEGDALVATVNGAFTVTAHDTTLTKGPSSFVIMKGLLLKKVEVQALTKE